MTKTNWSLNMASRTLHWRGIVALAENKPTLVHIE
jgi:hypothetical protein